MTIYVQLLSSSVQPALRVGQRSKVTMRELAISCTFYQGAQTTGMTSLGTEHMILKSSQGHVSWVAPGWHSLILPLALELSLEAIFGHGWSGTESKVPYDGRFTSPCSNRPANSPEMRKCPSFTSFACRTLEDHFCKISPLWRHNGHHPWLVEKHPARWWFHPVFSLELQQIWLSQHFCLCVIM